MPTISTSRSASLPGFLVATLFVLSPVCQQSGEAADVASDRALCRRLWEGHLEAVTARQPEKVAFTTDAVLVYPDMLELRGRDAIQAHLAKAFAGVKILETGFKIDRCEVVGGRAYTFVTVDELTQEGAAQARHHARCAAVWEEQPDKSWQIAHLLVNYRKL